MTWDGKSALLAGVVAGLIAFPLGYTAHYYETYVEPWDDGLVHIDCPRGTDHPNVEFNAQGFAVFDDGDAKHPQSPYVDINMPFDPKTQKIPPSQDTHLDPKRFPLGCFVTGIRQKDIVRRSWR